MSDGLKNFPYTTLGHQLKHIREKRRESINEVADAIEIEVETLLSFEHGHRLPCEEELFLLINHFALRRDEAQQLWKLAGYDFDYDLISDKEPNETVVLVPLENHAIYTDACDISVNDKGVILAFSQNFGDNRIPVSKIGMSNEQAKNLLINLHNALRTHNINSLKLLSDKSTTLEKRAKNPTSHKER